MSTINDNSLLYQSAWKKWGSAAQLVMVMEECAELQQVCSKLIRMKKGDVFSEMRIAEEIVDVQIMLEQLKQMYCYSSTIDRIKKKKLARLRKLVEA